MTQRTPSLQEQMVALIDYSTSGMYTAIPGTIVSIESGKEKRVNVKPAINMRSEDGELVEERSVILNVPYQTPSSKMGGLSHPVVPGDSVLLVFSMRGLEIWKRSNGYPTTPNSNRRFSEMDCVAIPGVQPFPESTNNPSKYSDDHDPDDVVLYNSLGGGSQVTIRLKKNGDVFIKSPGEVKIECETAEVKASDYKVEADNVDFKSANFNISTGNYSMVSSGTAVSQGTINHQGSYVLNGTPIENHDHGGVQPGGDRTNQFGA